MCTACALHPCHTANPSTSYIRAHVYKPRFKWGPTQSYCDNTPWSQTGPVNPGWQMQEKLFTRSTHSAPFWHWDGVQSSISRRNKKLWLESENYREYLQELSIPSSSDLVHSSFLDNGFTVFFLVLSDLLCFLHSKCATRSVWVILLLGIWEHFVLAIVNFSISNSGEIPGFLYPSLQSWQMSTQTMWTARTPEKIYALCAEIVRSSMHLFGVDESSETTMASVALYCVGSVVAMFQHRKQRFQQID